MKKLVLIIALSMTIGVCSALPANATEASPALNCSVSDSSQYSFIHSLSDDDLLNLDEPTLSNLGLPPKPDSNSTENIEIWLQEVRQLSPLDLSTCTEQTSIYGYISNSSWAGYKVVGVSATTYMAVEGNFTVPTVTVATGCTANSSALASWVGIGGNANGLIQGGVIYYSGSTNPYFFLEYIGPNNTGVPAVKINLPTGVTLTAGDRLHIWVNYLSSGTMNFSFTNYTKGYSYTLPVQVDSYFYYGDTAEWVVERPPAPTGNYELYDFGSVTWTNMQVERSDHVWYDATSQNYAGMQIVSGSRVLVAPNVLTSANSFTDTFKACQ